MKRKFKIWAVSQGPFSIEELLYDKGYDLCDISEDGEYLVVCMVEEDNKLREEEFWFDEKEDAYNFKKYVDSRMEAIDFTDDGSFSYDYSGKMC